MAKRVGFALSSTIGMVLVLAAVGMQADSHIRIVRLSYIDGQVQMDRAGQGLEKAILNTPIIEGSRLVTGGSGLAEVEFENRSSLRMADNSEVKFNRLLMNDSGAKVNEIEVVRGIVYLDVQKSDDLYRVTTKDGSFLIRKGSELRFTAEDDRVQLAVFKGEVQVENQAQPLDVKKKQTVTLSAGGTGPIIAPGVDSISFDVWNNERAAYTSSYAQTFGGPVNGYGSQDLNYYGSYFYAPGYGYAWQPFGLMGIAGWNPYSAGAWMFNPGMGYSFASAYPWGWLPYHYGSWAYLPNAGWAWLPGGGSSYKGTGITTAFSAAPVITKAPAGFAPSLPPSAIANTPHRTIVLGQTASAPAFIPGGRVPPNFRAVLPSTATKSAANVKTGATFAAPTGGTDTPVSAHSAMAHPASGHVFAPPTNRTVGADLGMGSPSSVGMGGTAGRASGTPGGSMSGMPGAHSGATATHPSGHATGGTLQH